MVDDLLNPLKNVKIVNRELLKPNNKIINNLVMIEEDINKILELKKCLQVINIKIMKKLTKTLNIQISIKQKYITSSDLFRKNQKGMSSDNFENIYYNEVKSNISYNLPFMILSVIISYCLACFYIGSNFTSTQSIINAITLSFSLANGIYSGFRNGNKIIINDYKFVLDERIQIIKETYSKIEEASPIFIYLNGCLQYNC